MRTIKSHLILIASLSMLFTSCGGFQAKRVDDNQSDEIAMGITDEWLSRDTEQIVEKTIKEIKESETFNEYLATHGGKKPKVFIGDVQNGTSESYFPIGDINRELLYNLTKSNIFTVVDAKNRDAVLKEITYQNDGMVKADTAKKIGQQTGADLMVFGNVTMKPESRGGKTIKQYSVDIYLTNIESGEVVVWSRNKLHKASKQSGSGW